MNNQQSTWGALRWPFKAIIIAAPLLLLGYFGNKYNWFKGIGAGTESNTLPGNGSTSSNTTGDQSGSTSSNTEGQAKGTTTSARTFNYMAKEPVNGVLKGIVEVGATGFNSFVVSVDKDKNYKVISKDFGKSFVYEGMATTEDIRAGLKKYIAGIFDKGVQSKNVHFVISSGAQKEPKTKTISDELKKMGYVVNLPTAEQEGKYALRSVLPKEYYDNSFTVDVGSGNTKITWPNGDGLVSKEAPGAKYYEKGVSDADAVAQVTAAAKQVPAGKRSVCFIIGGVPYELANMHRNGQERYTVLNAPDSYKAGDKKKVECGIKIYKALMEATGCDTFVFDWDANFSIGFLMSLP
jgi:hypothetical protein